MTIVQPAAQTDRCRLLQTVTGRQTLQISLTGRPPPVAPVRCGLDAWSMTALKVSSVTTARARRWPRLVPGAGHGSRPALVTARARRWTVAAINSCGAHRQLGTVPAPFGGPSDTDRHAYRSHSSTRHVDMPGSQWDAATSIHSHAHQRVACRTYFDTWNSLSVRTALISMPVHTNSYIVTLLSQSFF